MEIPEVVTTKGAPSGDLTMADSVIGCHATPGYESTIRAVPHPCPYYDQGVQRQPQERYPENQREDWPLRTEPFSANCLENCQERSQDAKDSSGTPTRVGTRLPAMLQDQLPVASCDSSPHHSPYIPSASLRTRPHKASILAPHLIVPKADKYLRLDSPNRGPRSPRLRDEFGNLLEHQLDTGKASEPVDGEGVSRSKNPSWRNKFDDALLPKRSSDQSRRNEEPSPYRLVMVSEDSSASRPRRLAAPSGSTIIHVQQRESENKARRSPVTSGNAFNGDQVETISYAATSHETDQRLNAREAEDSEGSIASNYAEAAQDTMVTSSHARTDSAVVMHGKGKPNGSPPIAAERYDVRTPSPIQTLPGHTRSDERDSSDAFEDAGDSVTRLETQSRPSSNQASANGSSDDSEHQDYINTSTETVRVYPDAETSSSDADLAIGNGDLFDDGRNPTPGQSFTQESGVFSPALEGEHRVMETVPEESPETPMNDQATQSDSPSCGAGIAVSPDRHEPAERASSAPADQESQPNKQRESRPNTTTVTLARHRVTINFSRKGSLDQVRRSTTEDGEGRQTAVRTTASNANSPSRHQGSRLPRLSDAGVTDNSDSDESRTSPSKKQSRGSSIPVPKRAIRGQSSPGKLDEGLRKVTEESIQPEIASKATSPSRISPIRSPEATDGKTGQRQGAGNEAGTDGDDASMSSDKSKPIVLPDGYTLKQLSDISPVHGPQLRVAPDASRFIMGSPTLDQDQGHKGRPYRKEFRMSDGMLALGGSEAEANSSRRLSTARKLITSYSATSLRRGAGEGEFGLGVEAQRYDRPLRSAPIPSKGSGFSPCASPTKDRRPASRATVEGIRTAASKEGRPQSRRLSAQWLRGNTSKTRLGAESRATDHSSRVQSPVESTSTKPSSPEEPAKLQNPVPPKQAPSTAPAPALTPAKPPAPRLCTSTSSLRTRYYNHSALGQTVPLPRNVIQTAQYTELSPRKLNPNGTARQPALTAQTPQNYAGAQRTTYSAPTANTLARRSSKRNVNGNAGNGSRQSMEPLLRQEDSNTKKDNGDSTRKSGRANRGGILGRLGIFHHHKKDHKTDDQGQPTQAPAPKPPRAKLVKKQPKQKQTKHASLQIPGQQQPQQTTTANMALRRQLSQQEKAARPATWQAPGSGRYAKAAATQSQVPARAYSPPQPNRQKLRKKDPRRTSYVGKGIKAPAGAGAASKFAEHPLLATAPTGPRASEVEAEMARLLDTSRASSMTAFTMEVLDAARREVDEVKKERMIKIGKILVEAVNNAHEAEKSMLAAVQAAKRAEFSCALAQENAAQMTQLARQTMEAMQVGSC